MKALYEEQIKAKLNGCHDNIATVLQLVDEAAMQVSLEEISSEKQVIQALEKKYDALKDKLIIEVNWNTFKKILFDFNLWLQRR